MLGKTKKSQTGQYGEDAVCEYLKDHGYKILERNAREKWGEIDIIAKASDKTLCFIEVKALNNMGNSGLNPEDHLTSQKLEKIKRTAQLYVAKHPEMVNEEKGWRIDLAAVDILVLPAGGLTKWTKQFEIRYYENI